MTEKKFTKKKGGVLKIDACATAKHKVVLS